MLSPSPGMAHHAARWMVPCEVWREQTSFDAGGGQEVGWGWQADTTAYLTSPSASEVEIAVQQGQDITHTAVMPTGTVAKRGDRLVFDTVIVGLVTDPVVATHSALSRATANRTSWQTPT